VVHPDSTETMGGELLPLGGIASGESELQDRGWKGENSHRSVSHRRNRLGEIGRLIMGGGGGLRRTIGSRRKLDIGSYLSA